VTLLAASFGQAQSVIISFTATPENADQVNLEWTTGNESGVSEFKVERSLDGLTYLPLEDIGPQGNSSTYLYEDRDIYKSSTRTYYYRIRAVMSNGTSSLSTVQSVVMYFSGIQQTWGSIKALFR